MTFTQVQYALQVEKDHSFSRAAQSLFVSQPALSLQIAALESELGYALFCRTSRGTYPTEAGQNFCCCARRMMTSWDRFVQEVQPQALSSRHFRICVGARVYSNGLFAQIAMYFEKHPELEVTFRTESGQDFLTELKNGALDVAIDRMPAREIVRDYRDFTAVELISERQCVLMSETDPRSRKKSITFSELQDCTVITALENTIEDRDLRRVCRTNGITLKRIYRSDGIDTNMNLVRGGNGMVIGPESFGSYFGVACVPLAPPQSDSLQFICLRKNAGRPEIRQLGEYLRQICRR